MKSTFVLSLLTSSLLFLGGEAHTLKQAKARDIARAEKYSDLIARAPPVPSPGNPICHFTGLPCKTFCCSDCHPITKRDNAARDMWILPGDFSGEVFPAAIIAGLIKGDGIFIHTNGTTVTDWSYKEKSEGNRGAFWKNTRRSGIMDKVKRGFINFTVPYLAKTIAIYFDEPDKVFALSDNSGVANRDIIRLAKALLEEKEQQEFLVWHHSLDRTTIQAVVDTLCPRLGPEYCDN